MFILTVKRNRPSEPPLKSGFVHNECRLFLLSSYMQFKIVTYSPFCLTRARARQMFIRQITEPVRAPCALGARRKGFIMEFRNRSFIRVQRILFFLGTFFALTAFLRSSEALDDASQKALLRDDPKFMPALSPADRESLLRNAKILETQHDIHIAEALPSRVVNIDHLPAVWSQGSQPTCMYWATVYYQLSYQEAREHGWVRPHPINNPDKVMSQEFVIQLGGMYDVIKYLGCGTWESFANEWDSTKNLPTSAGYAKARLHRARDFYLLPSDPSEATVALKQRLADGDIVATSILISDYFYDYDGTDRAGWNNTVFFEDGGGFWAGHALTLIGYDDTISYNTGSEVKTGAFLLVNSWGGAWGHTLPGAGSAGFIWIGYDYAQSANLLRNAVIMEPQPSVDDTNFVRFGVEHDAFIELNSKIIAGDPADPDTFIPLRNLFGNREMHEPFDIGIDRLVEEKRLGLRLSILDEDLSGGMLGDSLHTGFITDFSVKLDAAPTTWTAT
ncbi:MAG: hypothetical protein ACOC2L_05540, partial [Candidatus Sumerlaeota bacterium]